MKKSVLFLLFSLCLTFFSNGMPERSFAVVDEIHDSFIHELMGDSVWTHAKDKHYVFMFTGYHGFIWSMITSDSSGYKLFHGRTAGRPHELSNHSIDTANFISRHIRTIEWAFDTLPGDTVNLIPNKKEYNQAYFHIYIHKESGELVTIRDEMSFTSGDNKIANDKLTKLRLLLYWMAMPGLMEDYYDKLPDDSTEL